MTEETALTIFKYSWGLLIFIAILAQILFEDKPKKKAGFVTNLSVVTPFIFVFGLFYLGAYFGSYDSTIITRVAGTVITVLGMISYVIAILFLRKNWSLSASIKEGQKLVRSGPYRCVRHPIYSSMILVFFGSGLLIGNYLILLCTPIVGVAYYMRARKEEALLNEEFPEYSEYTRETKMLIPGIF